MKISLFPNQRGNGPSFEELLMPHMEQLHRLAYHYTGQQSDAEDLVQDLVVKLFQKNETLQKIEKLRPWLAKSLYRIYIDRWRQQKRQATDTADHETLENHSINTNSITFIDRYSIIHDLQWAMTLLNDDQRILITMHDAEAYTLEELSMVLEAPIGTLKSRLHRGRAKLRELLTSDGTISRQTACL